MNKSYFHKFNLGSAKFEPQEGYTYSGAGQCIESILAMSHALPENKKPVIIALYESIDSNGYWKNPDIMEAHNFFPGAFLQIGLQLPVHNKEELEKVGSGRYDNEIGRMSENYKSIKLPIFLRIGYEFDGEWNGYDSEAYKKAYRRIVDLFKEKGVENVAFVWNTYIVDNLSMFEWYPDNPETGEKDGDNYVDWFSYNTMSQKFEATWFMEQAAAHKKPVMLGESSYAIVNEGYSFEDCMEDYFKAIKRYGIKAYQYINWEWQAYPEFTSWNTWKNGRYTDNKSLIKCYNGHMDKDNLLFRDSAYYEPLALFVNCARKMKEADGGWNPWRSSWDHSTLKQGFNYNVINSIARYGDGWHPFWESIDNTMTIEITLPKDSPGYLFFAVNLGNTKVESDNIQYWLIIAENTYKISLQKGGYFKIPIGSQISQDGILVLRFVNLENNQKVRISQIGFMTTHSMPLQAPKNLLLKIIPKAVELHWDYVEGTLIYNIYRNNQLIGMTDSLYYIDELYCHGVSSYSVSACSEFKGEGIMSDPITINME